MIKPLFMKNKHKDALSLEVAELYLDFYGNIRNRMTYKIF